MSDGQKRVRLIKLLRVGIGLGDDRQAGVCEDQPEGSEKLISTRRALTDHVQRSKSVPLPQQPIYAIRDASN